MKEITKERCEFKGTRNVYSTTQLPTELIYSFKKFIPIHIPYIGAMMAVGDHETVSSSPQKYRLL